MQKLLFLCLGMLLFSCGKDSLETEQNLSGTWILSSVSGSCLGLPIDATANNIGCVDLPALEVNCSIIEMAVGGTLTYAYNLVKGSGTYTIDGDKINICTDRCLTYTWDGNVLSLQTGTNGLCDPTYIFSQTFTSLDELILTNQRKFISTISKNGRIVSSYSYNSDGSLESLQRYRDNGDLFYSVAYSFTPLTATSIRTFASSGTIHRYEYYNEAPDRTRRDFYGSGGTLDQYRLYFHDSNDCWIERSEDYENNTLTTLTNYKYTGDHCNLEYSQFSQGVLTMTYTSQRDGKRFYGESTLFNILQYQNISNTTSAMYFKNGQVDADASYNSEFTYGEGDYPISEIRTYIDGTVDLYTYSYE